MINSGSILLFLGGFSILVISVYVGFRVVDSILSRGVYSTNNAEELLSLGKPEDWNALRLLNPGWQPTLVSKKLVNLNLSGVDFRRAKLDETDFSRCVLDDADFSSASLKAVNFSGASLRRANFEYADMEGVNLEGAILDGASLKDVNLQNTKLPERQTIPPKSVESDRKGLPLLIRENPNLLSEISPRQFEELVAEVLILSGYNTTLTGGSRDKGVDIIASRSDPFGEITSVIECKHYSIEHPVGVSTVRALNAAKQYENANRAVLVTSSRFTSEARELASKLPDLELIDREQLLKLIRDVINSSESL